MNKVEEFNNSLYNKNVLILGIGVSNLPLIEYLYKNNANIFIKDKKEKESLDKNILDLIDKYKIPCVLGNNYLDDIGNYDIIFRSPSILPTNPYLVKEKENGAIITTEIEQVIKLAPCRVIGITGSKGKTTTTTLVYKTLEALGYNVHVGGNIGKPIFTMMDKVNEEDIIVLELSSFQLMNMDVSPNIAVVTNISQDHLDVHKDYQEYIDAKKNIYLNQNKEDILVLNYDDSIVKEFAKEAKGKIRYFSSSNIKDSYVLDNNYIKYNDNIIIDTNEIKLKGKHNYLNICCMLSAIKDYLDIDMVKKVLKEFNGVEHRLEFVRELNGVEWYNDSASTSPDKAKGAIEAFTNCNVTLIAGGYDKNLDYEPLAEYIYNSKINKLILFGETKNKINTEVNKIYNNSENKIDIYVLNTLDEVINKAKEITNKGDVVIFSPASASFDMFKSAYQRGNLFKEKVHNLK